MDCNDPDDDNDGFVDAVELEAGSNPRDRLSRPVRGLVSYKNGLNLVAIPMNRDTMPDAYSLLAGLGNSAAIESLRRLDTTTGHYQEAHDNAAGEPIGDNFLIIVGEGLILDAKSNGGMSVDGIVQCPTLNLRKGPNLIATPCAPADYGAYDFLRAAGGAAAISSVQRFNREMGRFGTASYRGEQLYGDDFPMVPGEAYFAHMRTDVDGLTLE